MDFLFVFGIVVVTGCGAILATTLRRAQAGSAVAERGKVSMGLVEKVGEVAQNGVATDNRAL